MRRTLVALLLAVVLTGHFSTLPVQANAEQSFKRTLSTLPVVLEAIEDFDRDHPLLPGDTLTYGKLITNGNLPGLFCEKTVEKDICGGSSVDREFQHAKGPPMTMFDTFAVVRIVIPFWNIEQKHRDMLTGVLEDRSAILATWQHSEGDIPVVLTETRTGALRRFIRYLRQDNTSVESNMSI